MSRFEETFFSLLFILGTFYLVLPAPREFPDLPNSIKSIEPGDTTQKVNVSAYYTDLSRSEVLNFYSQYFSRSPFLNLPLFSYRLNHPPERIREVLRDTQQSTYVEEVIHPLRESVFISGFEWDNDPFTPPERRIKNILMVEGKTYRFKVTLYYQESRLWQRLLVYYLFLISFYLLIRSYEVIFRNFLQRDRR